MITKSLSILGAVLFLAIGPMLALAQDQQLSAKNLYIAHSQNSRRGRPGVRITVRLNRNGQISTVPLTYNFRSGDKVKFLFETNFNAHVRILNLGTRGDLQTLYPYAGASENVSQLRNYEIPRGAWFEFDDVPGTEQLAFLFSRRPIVVPSETDASSVPLAASSTGGITPTRPPLGAKSLGDQAQQALEEGLQNAKDFKLVPDTQGEEVCAYGLLSPDQVDRIVSVKIDLKHR
ncbi:MAG: DUF4384 domain-containing protein [Blastocatellia bacterium]